MHKSPVVFYVRFTLVGIVVIWAMVMVSCGAALAFLYRCPACPVIM